MTSDSGPFAHSGLRRHEYATDHIVGRFSFDSTCALFDSALRLQLVALSGDVVAFLHGFTEYRFGFIRFVSVRAPASLDERRLLLTKCDWRDEGIAVPFTHNNFMHALYHAVPSFEALGGNESGRARSLAFLPLFAHSTGADGRKTSVAAVASWHAWELTLRALSEAPASALHAATEGVLRAPCTCFRRLRGSTAPFVPASPASASRLRRWASAVMLNVWRGGVAMHDGTRGSNFRGGGTASAGGAGCRTLFIRRSKTRVLSNEADLLAALRPTDRVELAELQLMPLSAQLRLVSAASGMVGVHGQALALAPFLGLVRAPNALTGPPGEGDGDPSHQPSLVEILPSAPARTAKMPFYHLYEALSVALGVEYRQVIGSYVRPCSLGRLRGRRVEAYLACNLTVAPIRFVRAIRRMRCHSANSASFSDERREQRPDTGAIYAHAAHAT
jgi:hypothetical protein